MRILDIFLSGFGIIVLSPLLVIILPVLKLTGEGEILFFQQRVGFRKEKFGIIKFATMLKDSPNIGAGTITEKNDTRVLPVGKILRKTKINELPQLVNVLIGNMSLVGPRPHAERDLNGVDPIVLEKFYQSNLG